MDRAQFLRLGVTGALGAAGAGGRPGSAAAALPPAVPRGDDVGFLSFGVVAELTSLAWYRRALRVAGFSRTERHRLRLGAMAKRDHVTRMNAALGPDAVRSGDFAAAFPARSTVTRARALDLGAEIERLLVGVYLNGAAFAGDAGTRLLLGRLLARDAQQLSWIHGLTGRTAGLPGPQTLEQAGTALDRLVTTPSFTS